MTADHARWTTAVGTEFGATDEAGQVHTLRLESCSPLLLSGEWASFTLIFTAGSEDAAQGTYLLTPAALTPTAPTTAAATTTAEPEAVFLVPVGRRAAGVDLEAVFNQRNEDPRD